MNQTTTEPMKSRRLFSTQSLVIMAMFTAILCISAYISIPLPNGSHITFLNFVITLIILLFSARKSTCMVCLWLLMGCLGIPVFIGGNSSIGYIIGPWGGYSVAFLLCGIFIPFIRGEKYNRIRYTFAAILSVIIVDLVGSLWIMVMSNVTLPAALVMGFVPFIVLDVVKAVVVAQIVPIFRKVMPAGITD